MKKIFIAICLALVLFFCGVTIYYVLDNARLSAEIKKIEARKQQALIEMKNQMAELEKIRQKIINNCISKKPKVKTEKSNSGIRTPNPVNNSSKLPTITMADLPNTNIGYINKLYPYAKETEKKYGIPSQVFLAQACLETGYGKHIQGNNIFGIGHTVGKRKLTTVKKNGRYIKLYCSTYRYSSINDCINAYAKLLTTKYPKVMEHSNNSEKFVVALGNSRYCIHKSYSKRLNSIIKKYNL